MFVGMTFEPRLLTAKADDRAAVAIGGMEGPNEGAAVIAGAEMTAVGMGIAPS